jgi:toxin ParE1/3/4
VGIVTFIQEDDPAMAKTVGRRILKATEQLSAFPGSGPPGRIEGTREKLVLGMPYIFVYRAAPTGGHVEILRVMP